MFCWNGAKYQVLMLRFSRLLHESIDIVLVCCSFNSMWEHTCEGQRTDRLWGQFSPSTMWAWGINLRQQVWQVAALPREAAYLPLVWLWLQSNNVCWNTLEGVPSLPVYGIIPGTLVFFKSHGNFIHSDVWPWDFFFLLIFCLFINRSTSLTVTDI